MVEKGVIKIYYQNVNGMKTKVNEFRMSMLTSDYDIIVLTETWLREGYYDSELFSDDYTVYRVDRDLTSTVKKDGGGCIIAVKSKLFSNRIIEWECSPDDVWIGIDHLNGEKSFINVKYIPCKSKMDYYKLHFDKLSEIINGFESKANFLLMGDYNFADSIKWRADSNGVCKPYDVNGSIASAFVDFLAFTDLCQFNYVKNVNNRSLDLVLSNIDQSKVNLTRSDNVLLCEDRHHPALNVMIDTDPLRYFDEKRPPKTNFFRANFEQIKVVLSDVNWPDQLDSLSLDDAVLKFYDILKPVIDQIPRTRKSEGGYPHWYSRELIDLIKRKQSVRAKHKYSAKYGLLSAEVDRVNFLNLRKSVKNLIVQCRLEYIGDIEDKIDSNSKAFFSYTKSLKNTNSLPNQMQLDGVSANKSSNLCDLFASFFESVYDKSIVDGVYGEVNSEDFYKDEELHPQSLTILREDILMVLRSFDDFKVSTPDGVPMVFFKKLSDVLAEPLLILFNKSLSDGIFATYWKVSHVTPIFKSGKKSDVRNYRPISILCAISKILEKIVAKKVYALVESLIHDYQHGFRPRRSTETNLLEYITHLKELVKDGGQVDAIYTDLAKAFDKVSHCILLWKLRYKFGIRGSVLLWIASYLSNRTQFVMIGGFKSRRIAQTSGVPQGSILGPLLFMLFINDLPEVINSRCLLFADDNKIYRKIETVADCSTLQEDVHRLTKWCAENQLQLNIGKCNVISFTNKLNPIVFDYYVSTTKLQRVTVVKDLGVYFDCSLAFNYHVDKITRKAYRFIGFMFRSGQYFRRIRSFFRLYNSYVRSGLEYCSSVWAPFYLGSIDKLEKVQNRFTKLIYVNFRFPYQKSNVRLQQLEMHSLETRRIIHDEIILFKIIHRIIDSSLFRRISFHHGHRTTRHNETRTFYPKKTASNFESHSPIIRMQNNHDCYFRTLSITDPRFKLSRFKVLILNVFPF